MNIEKDFLIPFTGLKNGKHSFDFKVDDSFFENYNFSDFNHITADINVLLDKKINLFELHFTSKGFANVPCDVTNQDFDLPIDSEIDLVVKFGEAFNDDHDEILIIPYTEHHINVAQYIYEMIALAIPQKRVHPGVKDGTLDSAALDYLGYVNEEDEDEFDSLFDDEDDEIFDLIDDLEDDDVEEEEENTNKDIDPRWAELKKLLTDK
ncbi:DUF177 domain-containing protein [Myroides odoratimimus]|uniref:YceD family protein n=1 Tax=Myroides odoratimimus TaxID=76832 RepID=UPI00217F7433|nr:DUF177 domain-containing protein [Myroides odoratimimus]MCS7474358.1 DUF177 domain-containing protein [Myroides odoratimimus]MDM1413886.1 DUF177 domain-containing protein [Myroides odoratimimus]MDM1446134.1 DUF177 domain-containing protein [Myroides odoratimimus]MDM1508422.1 DUF177 domain-containing protein [Myroides odoratimimus]MDM1518969.1 DUF177 domain-containing protein [Myroides odoratimimus]